MKILGFICLLITSLHFQVQAHGGRTDSSGGHNCSAKSQSKGLCSGYHYHNSGKSRAISLTAPSPQIKKKRYDRDDWPHWVDSDNDCQNSRAEILIESSKKPVKFKRNKGCNVTQGEWLDPYTLQTFTKASDIDIDHIIPLAYAHKNGGSNWPKAKKREFANDPENLLAVEDNANQEKGAQSPLYWMPENKAYHCTYLKKWKDIKNKYGLSSTKTLDEFIRSTLSTCR